MATRTCDGTDPNLTRQVHEVDYMPRQMTASPEWQATARPDCVVIRCQCGLVFDDTERLTTYPHEFLGQGALFDAGGDAC